MAVRLKVKVALGKKAVDTVAIANAGYESDKPEILIPTELARKLEVWPEMPAGTKFEEFLTAGGPCVMHVLEKPAKVSSTLRKEKKIDSTVVISTIKDEVLLSDKLIGALEIDIINAGTGEWRFRTETVQIIRASEKPMNW